MKFNSLMVLLVAALSFGAGRATSENAGLHILAMGDSLMASHAISRRSIADFAGKALNQRIKDHSVLGARMIYNLPISGALGLSIPKQYRKGDWDWVVLNGGGNDLWLGCGCSRCERKMNKLIAKDGDKGRIPELISKIRTGGARVVYVGYLRSPGVGSMIEECRDEGDELEQRIEQMAKADKGVFFVSLKDLVPYGDRSYHMVDMIHPSIKASRAIGLRVARVIKNHSIR